MGEPEGSSGGAPFGAAGATGWPDGTAGAAAVSGGGAAGAGGATAGGAGGVGTAGGAGGAAGSAGAAPAAPSSNGTTISCNGTPCQSPAQHCCITGEGSGNPPSFQCIPLAVDCGLFALERMCDAGEDCPAGTVCCASTTYPSTPSKCRAECATGEQRTCWTGSECGAEGPFCCFFPGRPAGFCKPAEHAGATLCVK